MRIVRGSDIENFSNNAVYLSDKLQPLPYTPFMALLAKERHSETTTDSTEQDKRETETYSIGVLGKNSVKEVSWIIFSIDRCVCKDLRFGFSYFYFIYDIYLLYIHMDINIHLNLLHLF